MKRMKRIFGYIAVFASAVLLLAGCSDDDSRITAGTGYLRISLEPQLLCEQESGSPVALPGIDIPSVDEFGLTLTDASGRYSRRWDDFAAFTQNELYYTGTYHATAFHGLDFREGFNEPTFYCETEFSVKENSLTDAVMRPCLINAVFMTDYAAADADVQLLFHTPDGLDYIYPREADELLFLEPGEVETSLVVTSAAGSRIAIPFTSFSDIKAGYYYKLTVATENKPDNEMSVTVTFDNADGRSPASITVTPSMLSVTPPVISLAGVQPDTRLQLVEGELPSVPVKCTVSGVDEGSRLILTSRSAWLVSKGLAATIDLLKPSESLSAAMKLGLIVEREADGTVTVDFTRLLGTLVCTGDYESLSSFELKALTPGGISSLPVGFEVSSINAAIEITDVATALVGASKTTLTVRADTPVRDGNISIRISDDEGQTWKDAVIESVDARDDGLYDITFGIPEGSHPLLARIYYSDELRVTVEISRRSPDYSLEVDAFATYALVKIEADSPETVAAVTRYVNFTVNGSRASVLSRNPDNGIIVIIGLTPSTKISLGASVIPDDDGTDANLHQISFRTESNPQVPNGDFEDWRESIRYSNLPQGGRYAQYTVEIFNRQHTTSYRLSEPTGGWATVNEKTFCRDARNYNTWYMQPSAYTVEVDEAYSGGYAMTLVSTAWDTDGPEIPDYLPPGPPFTNYSLIIPDIAQRASGRLFLGSYRFDASTMTETYTEGIDWDTRPSALNGFYRYSPSEADRSDYGTVAIEVLGRTPDGKEVVIGQSEGRLPIAISYTSFSLPISYSMFGVKATKLKIMFSSSASSGDIAHERTSVHTWPDPVTSTSLGSRLWLDKLEFAY